MMSIDSPMSPKVGLVDTGSFVSTGHYWTVLAIFINQNGAGIAHSYSCVCVTPFVLLNAV